MSTSYDTWGNVNSLTSKGVTGTVSLTPTKLAAAYNHLFSQGYFPAQPVDPNINPNNYPDGQTSLEPPARQDTYGIFAMNLLGFTARGSIFL